MTAADQIALDALKSIAYRYAVRIAALAVLVAAFSLSYCAGRRHGSDAERSRMADSVRKVLADSSQHIEERIVWRTDTLRIVTQHAVAARHDAFQSIKAVKQRLDSLPSDSLPTELVIPAIKNCVSALIADSIEVKVVAAQLDDMTKDRDVWKSRALMDEKQAKRSRFGFKTGAVIGVLAAVAVKVILR